MDAWTMIVMGAINIVCFAVGAKVGQQAAKGEPVKLEIPNPAKAYREHKAEKEADREKQREKILLENIDRYDGFSGGQQEIPR